ncbi:jacalin-related lectin 3-like [Tasmannia lanceolata]|uniref:jacalin-related lectin 3-like n=1 Tax=Tasmannia lanceolata TaxID=3420 RepID=UPI0040634494
MTLVRAGSVGGVSGDYWEDSVEPRIIFVSHGSAINSIQFAYEQGNGETGLTARHGGVGDNFEMVELDDQEHLTLVSGHYGFIGSVRGIKTLTFCTNRNRQFGPFGGVDVSKDTPFRFVVSEKSIAGFHGRSNSSYLFSLGIFCKGQSKCWS